MWEAYNSDGSGIGFDEFSSSKRSFRARVGDALSQEGPEGTRGGS